MALLSLLSLACSFDHHHLLVVFLFFVHKERENTYMQIFKFHKFKPTTLSLLNQQEKSDML